MSEAQRTAGRDSRHAWAIDSTLWSKPLSAPLHTVAAGLDHFLFREKDFDAPISLMRDELQWPSHRFIKEADIIHLHNVNGMTRVGELSRAFPTKKIVWTLHDMNPFTGACHYSLGCAKYSANCSSCPAVKDLFQPLVERAFERKLNDLRGVENLQLVAPSRWLADFATLSPLMSAFPATTITNPLHPHFFGGSVPSISKDRDFVLVAQNLDDPVKNVREAVTAFSRLRSVHPRATMGLVGRGGESYLEEGIELLGTLDQSHLASALGTSRALVVPSRAENAPLVIAEAASQGCLPIVRLTGGMPEMIQELGAGHTFLDSTELEAKMASVLTGKPSTVQKVSQRLRAQAEILYSPDSVRKQYDSVYDR